MIKKITCVVLLCVITKLACAQGINFVNGLSWQQVKEKAKRENKFIFLDCYATWCGPCKQMDEEVYPLVGVGNVFNKDFISVKVQFDQTSNDSENVKSWYSSVEKFKKQFHISAFPTYLYFNPDGNLVYRRIGYMKEQMLIETASLAQAPQRLEDVRLIEAYRKGERNYDSMLPLINVVREVFRERELADSMAVDFISNVLNHKNEDNLLDSVLVDFIASYEQVVKTTDKPFWAIYNHPDIVNKNRDYDLAGQLIYFIVERQELEEKLFNGNKPINLNPDWSAIKNTIIQKYPKIDAQKMIANYQFARSEWGGYFWRIKKFNIYADSVDRVIAKPAMTAKDAFWCVNTAAWMGYKNWGKGPLLTKALGWSKVAVDVLKKENASNNDLPSAMDTQARILYKIGRKKEAVTLITKAIDLIENNLTAEQRDRSKLYHGEKQLLSLMKKSESIEGKFE